MTDNNDLYKKVVLEDISNYEGLYTPVKASLTERLLVRKVPLEKLHCNPKDEFCNPEVGPNYEIVSSYRKEMSHNMTSSKTAPTEPLIIEKLATDDYMILNGHHRWLAAKMLHIPKIPVRIVNGTQTEYIIQMLRNSDKEMVISFDLDEVLLCEKEDECVQAPVIPFANKLFPKALRLNANALINKVQDMGFDVWVYTGEYYSPFYINLMFLFYGIRKCHSINGLNEKRSVRYFRKYFTEKYRIIAHADTESVLLVNTATKDYDSVEVPSGKEWATKVYHGIEELLNKQSQDQDVCHEE